VPIIGAISISSNDIFDVTEPDEDRALYRVANRLHVSTRPDVIRQQLLFEVGDASSWLWLTTIRACMATRWFRSTGFTPRGSFSAALSNPDRSRTDAAVLDRLRRRAPDDWSRSYRFREHRCSGKGHNAVQYDHRLVAVQGVDERLRSKALAHSVWSSLAYEKSLYRLHAKDFRLAGL
jgi:hypothetical protein